MRCFNHIAIAAALVLWCANVNGQDKTRTLIYDTQRNYSVMVLVSVTDAPPRVSGQVIIVPIGAGSRRSIPLRITRTEFDKIWANFLSSGIDQYPIEKARHTIDLDYYYVFMAGGHKYAIPKKTASPTTAALAKQMEAYANNTPELRNLPRAPKPIEPERVIIR
jgi:hypothetical protein